MKIIRELITRLEDGYPISDEFRLKSVGRDEFIVHGKGVEVEFFAEMLVGESSREITKEMKPISGDLTPELQAEILGLVIAHFEKHEGPVELR